ncbi:DUF4124 domain-containing protein [Variovorax sp. LT1P1]|uniref:DUF4124 domain-containing protein n=1 Tax=Variovorax sp. LT1P1 TaxID=3443730 RepID=UPI003F486699
MGQFPLATLISALLLVSLPAAAYYRCTDETGVVFRDRPCERAIRAEHVSPGGRVLSSETGGNSPHPAPLNSQRPPTATHELSDSTKNRQSTAPKSGRL